MQSQRRNPYRAKLIARPSSALRARVRGDRLTANTQRGRLGRRLDVADRETLLTAREVTHGKTPTEAGPGTAAS